MEDTTNKDTGTVRYKIVITSGSLKGTSYPIESQLVTLGRSAEAGIRIDDTLISRQHCQLSYSDGRWFLEDLSSTNGTWLVGQNVQGKAYLPLETPVRIGKTMFEIVDTVATGAVAAAKAFQGWKTMLNIPAEEMVEEIDEAAKSKSSVFQHANAQHLLAAIYSFQHAMSAVQEERELYPKALFALNKIMPDYDLFLLTYNVQISQFEIRSQHLRENTPRTSSSRAPEQLRMELVDRIRKSRSAAVFMSNGGELVVIVPMFGKQQINGLLYLSGYASRISDFPKEDLEMLSVIGHIAGMAAEHCHENTQAAEQANLGFASPGTASDYAHSLKNVITGLDGCVDLLRIAIDDGDKDLANEAWGILNKNYHRLNMAALNMLTLMLKPSLNIGVQDVVPISRTVSQGLVEPMASEKILLKCSLPEYPLLVEIDQAAFRMILTNLLLAAEQLILNSRTETGNPAEGKVSLSVGINEARTHLLLVVSCNGQQLTPSDAANYFNLNVQKKGSAAAAMDLAVSKRLADAHMGKVLIVPGSTPGTAFTCELPLNHAESETSTCPIAHIS